MTHWTHEGRQTTPNMNADTLTDGNGAPNDEHPDGDEVGEDDRGDSTIFVYHDTYRRVNSLRHPSMKFETAVSALLAAAPPESDKEDGTRPTGAYGPNAGTRMRVSNETVERLDRLRLDGNESNDAVLVRVLDALGVPEVPSIYDVTNLEPGKGEGDG